MSRFLVTGGAGFLGYHTIKSILSDPDNVVVVFDLIQPSYWDEWDEWEASGQIAMQYGSVSLVQEINKALIDVDFIVHLAGILGTAEQVQSPLASIVVNTAGTASVMQANLEKNNVPMVITVNGNHEWLNTYAITKEAAGRIALMFNKELNADIRVVRAFNAYGEWQKSKPIRKIGPEFILAAIRGNPIEIFGTGEQLFDAIYAGEVGEILHKMSCTPNVRNDIIYQAGSETAVNVNDFALAVRKTCLSGSEIVHVDMRQGEDEYSKAVARQGSRKQLEEVIGIFPFQNLDMRLPQVIRWYKEHMEI